MKKILSLLAVMAVVLTFTSCNNGDEIIDYSPVQFSVNIVSPDGENLLDAATTENLLDKPITITYNGKTTYVNRCTYPVPVDGSRAYPGTWYGGYILTGEQVTNPAITIGEFDGSFSCEYRVTLNVAGREYTLSVDSKVNGFNIKRKYYLDDAVNKTDNKFTIVIDPATLDTGDRDDNDLWIIDYAPIEFKVNITDAAGNDLLDPANTDNIYGQPFYITYHDRQYEVERYKTSARSRMTMPVWYGAKVTKDDDGTYMLNIGEFDGAINGVDGVILTIGDAQYTLAYSNYVDGMNVERQYYLDRQPLADNQCHIVVEK